MSNCSCYFSPWSSWYRESMLWDRSLVDHLPIVYPSTITYLRWKQRAGSSFIDWETVCGRGSRHLIFSAWLIVPVKNKVCMKFNAFCQWIAWNMSLDRSQFQPNSSIYPGETRRWRAEEFQALRLLERACRSCRVVVLRLGSCVADHRAITTSYWLCFSTLLWFSQIDQTVWGLIWSVWWFLKRSRVWRWLCIIFCTIQGCESGSHWQFLHLCGFIACALCTCCQ